MTEKRFNARLVNKHDIQSNWKKATNFIPMQGEIIVYDVDENYNYERFKIGDGVTNVNDLPFTVMQSDWVQTDSTHLDYIKNKPFGDVIIATDISGTICTIGEFTSGALTVGHDAIPLEIGQVWSVQGTNDANAKTVSVQMNDAGELYLGTPTVNDMPFYIRATETTLNSSYWYQMQPSHLTLTCVSGSVTTTSVKQLSQKYIPNADWNISDENTDGYVKNRTHYTVDRKLLASLEMSVENVDTYSVDDADSSDVIRRFINNGNSTADVFIDGVLYKCQAIFDDGNYYINLDGSTNTFQGIRIYIGGSKPNMIYLHPESFGLDMSAETRMVEIYTAEVVQQLDPKYIKDMYYEGSIEVFSVENAAFDNGNHISEQPFAIEDGNIYIVNWDGVEYTCESYIFEGIPAIGNTSEFGGKGNGEPFVIGYDKYENVTFVNSFDGLTAHTFSVVKIIYNTIPPKYIKDMYYEELKLNDIVLIDNVVLDAFEDTGSGFYSQYTDYHIDFVGTEGQTYFVIWDGIEYECVCRGIVEDFGIGNENVLGSYGSTTNEPFALHHSSSEDAICVSVKDNSTHTLSVIQRSMSPVIHQIDTKYLPILEEVSGVVFEAEEVFDESTFEGPTYKKLLGRYVVVVDGVSETIEFIDDFDYSWGETGNIYIETWDATTDFDGGYYIGFLNGNDVPHDVEIVGIKEVVKKEYLPDFVVATPNWNQNDPNGAGYIENRTHYEINDLAVVVPETEVKNRYTIALDNTDALVVGQKIVVTIDGAKYETTARENVNFTLNTGVNTYPIGIGSWMSADTSTQRVRVVQSVDDCPFALLLNNNELVFFCESDNATNDMRVVEVCVKNSEIHQIDEKFIPDTIARAIEVKEVKELVGDTSVPEQINIAAVNNRSDWFVNDKTSAAYVKNRPFYAEGEVVFENLDVTGNLLEPHIFESELTLTEGALYYVKGVYSCNRSADLMNVEFEGTYKCVNGEIAIFPYENSGEPVLIVRPNQVYIGLGNNYDRASATFYMLEELTKYHKIDANYLPNNLATTEYVDSKTIQTDWNQNDETAIDYIKNRTHYEEHVMEEIFNSGEHTVTGTYYDSTQFYQSFDDPAIGRFTSGETYRVSYCGTYVDVVGDGSYNLRWEDSNGIGWGVGSSNSSSNGDMCWFGANAGSTAVPFTTTLSIARVINMVHQLDEKYIPDTIARVEDVPTQVQPKDIVVTLLDDGTIDIPVNDLVTAYDNGSRIVVKNQRYGQFNSVISKDINTIILTNTRIVGNNQIEVDRLELSYDFRNDVNTWTHRAKLIEEPEIVQTTGDSTTALMSQKAITDLLPKLTTVTIPAANWTGDANPWSQVVTVNGVTANSKIDPQPTAVQIVELQNAEITLMLQNDNGIVTAWAIGNKPTKDYTMDVLITEVVRL